MTDPLERLQAVLGDRYTIERELGHGGMAIVYLAHDHHHARRVALKVFRPELAESIGSERFLREIQIAAQLTHPHILPLHDSGTADGILWYTMPFIEGESLRDRLDREDQLPLEDALQITREVAEGLGYAHALGIVHRDIKPENILLSGGHAVIADFGIARAVSVAGGEKLTETGIAIGTPAYMSPEQGTASAKVDARSDLYSLGCVLYEMLSGEPPFTGPSQHAVLAKKLSEPTPRISVVREAVPVSVEAALTKALAKVAADRFATVQQFAEALTAKVVPVGVGGGRTQRMRWVAIAGAAAVIVVAGVWGLSSLDGGPASGGGSTPTLAVLPFENLGGDSTQEYLSEGLAETLTASLAKVHGLDVIASTSTKRFKDDRPSLGEIGRELGADLLMQGSVLGGGRKARIVAQLVVASTGHLRWSDTYEGDLSDVLAFLSGVARSVAGQVAVALTAEDEERLAVAPKTNPQVMDAVLRARHLLEDESPENTAQAIRLMEQALDLDPAFAPAWGVLAHAQAMRTSWFARSESAEEVIPLAEQAARRALRLDSGDVNAQMAMATVYELRMQWGEAVRTYHTILARDPSYTLGRVYLTNLLTWMGQYDEAEALARKTLEIDPLSPMAEDELANVLANSGRSKREAMPYLVRAVQLDPNHFESRALTVGVLAALGYCSQPAPAEVLPKELGIGGAVSEAEQVLALFKTPTPWIAAGAAELFAECGRRDRALEMYRLLEAQAETTYVSPLLRVRVRVLMGDMDGVLELLEEGLKAHDPSVRMVTNGGSFQALRDSLRGNPRFDALVDRIGLPRSPLKWPT